MFVKSLHLWIMLDDDPTPFAKGRWYFKVMCSAYQHCIKMLWHMSRICYNEKVDVLLMVAYAFIIAIVKC